jgi:hypothetical protein
MQIAEQQSRLINLSNYINDAPDATSNNASALIGPEGGMVTVTDPASPIFGTALRVPAGALDTPVKITIQEGDHPCAFGLAPSIKLLPDGLHFKRATTLTVYLNSSEVQSDLSEKNAPAFFHYDESNDQWAQDSNTNLEQLGDAVLCELHHL